MFLKGVLTLFTLNLRALEAKKMLSLYGFKGENNFKFHLKFK